MNTHCPSLATFPTPVDAVHLFEFTSVLLVEVVSCFSEAPHPHTTLFLIGTHHSEVPHSSVCEIVTVCGTDLHANWTYSLYISLCLVGRFSEAFFTEKMATCRLLGVRHYVEAHGADKLLQSLLKLVNEHKLSFFVSVLHSLLLRRR